MKNRLNYRELLKNWMQFYNMSVERSKKMFASIWTRMQETKNKTDEKRGDPNGTQLERADRKSEK